MASRASRLVSRPALAALALGIATHAAAEITVDGTLGAPAGPVGGGTLPSGQAVDYLIGPELGALRGSNLFHSFGVFAIEAGRVGVFTGPPEVRNVVSRVTGGAQSRIDGTLGSTIAGASVFLVNPAGVVFGESAVISVPGSFYASTADLVRLADGEDFSASAPAGAPLSVAAPESFGFVATDPAPLELDLPALPLRGAPGATLALVGGDVSIRSDGARPGYLWSPAGPLHLVAVASDGSGTVHVGIAPVEGAIAVEGPAVGRAIEIRSEAVVSTSNQNPASPFTGAGRGGGDVLVFAGDLSVEDAELRAQTTGRDPGGDVVIELSGDFVVRETVPGESGIFAGTGISLGGGIVIGIDGDGGNVRIDARRVLVEGGGTLSTSSLTPGDPGEIAIRAAESVTLRGRDAGGQRSAVFSNTTVTGEGGMIEVEAPLLLMQEGGALVVQTTGTARGGDVLVRVGRLVLESTARIDSSTRSGTGAAGGNIRIRASESVEISGRQSDVEFSGVTTIAQPESSGDAGTIEIVSPTVTVADGGEVSATALGSGDGGRIEIEARRIVLRGGFVTTGALQGQGGDIELVASRNVALSRGSAIRASAEGAGDAGTIAIDAGTQFTSYRSEVSTEAAQGAGGRLEIRATKLVYLRDSAAKTDVASGSGGGGDVLVDPEFVALDRSDVVASAVGGDGGNIRISAGRFVASADSGLDASSELGIDGEVEIDAPDTDLAEKLSLLPSAYADPAALLREACAARSSNASTFLVLPRDRAPAPPDAPLTGPLDPPPGCAAP
jgi:filamentous hemagglutinin family protein